MAVTDAAFLDTSVLLAGLIELDAGAPAAQEIMEALERGRLRRTMTAWHCCLEFYSVSTRLPEELRLDPADALRLLEEEVLARIQVHDLPRKEQRTMLQSAAREGIAGGRIYDAHIAATALAARARVVVTDNRRHFLTLLAHGIEVLTTKELADRL